MGRFQNTKSSSILYPIPAEWYTATCTTSKIMIEIQRNA